MLELRDNTRKEERTMSTAPLLPVETAPEALPRKRFTRAEVEHLIETGFFEGQRFELIDGDLIDKMGQNPPHATGIRRAQAWLTKLFGDRVQSQLPIEAAAADREQSLPEPDVAVLAELKPEYDNDRHPRGDELLLVVEVSDSSAAFDLNRKVVLYANAGVPEYWVLDVTRRVLVVYRQPAGPTYRLRQIFFESDAVSMEGRTETIRVSDLLPAPK